MRVTFPVTASCAVAATLFGCAETSGIREHAAMIDALSRSDHERLSSGPTTGPTTEPTSDVVSGTVVVGAGALDRQALVAAVLARNPELDVARETWRAAAAAYPAAVALDDPMVSYAVAPLSIGSSAPFGQTIELRQKLPWPGKRRAAGTAALADADAAEADFTTLRLELAEATIAAFDDDYVAARALEVNHHHRELLERVERSAIAQYTAGRASQQDPLEARGELIALERERLVLETQQRAAVAKLNRLLRRRADAELPPPPARLAVPPPSGQVAQPHPRQQAAAARIRARGADVERARRGSYPDIELMSSYSSMWDMWQMRWMVGVAIEIPLQQARRHATIDMARAEQAKATAELAAVTGMLAEDQDRMRRDLEEATKALELYEHQLLPTVRARFEAAVAGFTAGQSSFSVVVMAERALRDAELQIEQARAELDRRTAAFDRATGQLPGGGR